MTWTVQLLNDDTTLNLNDGSAYTARPGFLAPLPARRFATGGANLFRHGSDIQERVYRNRVVTVTLRIHGTSQDNLIANINAINALLERAAEYSTTGIGSQVKLRRKWEGATNQLDFHVLEGILSIGDEFASAHAVNTTIATASLRLTCKPFAYGAEETIDNYVADPGFEIAGTALADWTESKTATGTTARDTSVKKNGNASLKLTMTNSGGSGQVIERNQVLADVDAGEVWSFQCWVRVDALSNAKVVMELDYNTGTDVEVSTTTVNASSFVKLASANNTVPGSVTQVTLRIRLESTASSATGVVYVDNVIAVLASAVPTAWVSSHTVANHYDDAAQAHTNYIDIHDVPGDVPAELQVRVAEAQASDQFWAGARHAGRQYDASIWLEAEDGTTATTNVPASHTFTATSADHSNYSDGTRDILDLERDSGAGTGALAIGTYGKITFSIASPPKGQFRVLVGGLALNGQGASTTTHYDADDFALGLNYTYGGFSLLDTTDPDRTSFVAFPSEALTVNDSSAMTILDIGTITIPPIETPDNQTQASFDLIVHMAIIQSRDLGAEQELQFALDWVMLMPIDFGSNYTAKTDNTDVLLLDSMSQVKGTYILNASNVVQSFPTNQLGRSPEAHPDGTRIYMVADDTPYTISASFTVSITYRPRFLHVMGA